MLMMKKGISANSIQSAYGINATQLRVLWDRYQAQGNAGIRQKKNNNRFDSALKKEIVLDIEENHLTLHAASLKYDAVPQLISRWLKKYREKGLAALLTTKKRGRPPCMGRPKKDSKPLTELERLRKEVQELKTENALLKKVRALVEERNARLREIGHGPSKD